MKPLGPNTLFRSMRSKIRGIMFLRMPFMISCRQFEHFMIDYFEGSLPQRQKFIFELHLKICRECRDYLKAYKRTIEITNRSTQSEKDGTDLPEVPEGLVNAIIEARRAQKN